MLMLELLIGYTVAPMKSKRTSSTFFPGKNEVTHQLLAKGSAVDQTVLFV